MNAMNHQASQPGYPAVAVRCPLSGHASTPNSKDDAQLDWVGGAQGEAFVSSRRPLELDSDAIRARHLLKVTQIQQRAHIARAVAIPNWPSA
jgi:hypothetical protein